MSSVGRSANTTDVFSCFMVRDVARIGPDTQRLEEVEQLQGWADGVRKMGKRLYLSCSRAPRHDWWSLPCSTYRSIGLMRSFIEREPRRHSFIAWPFQRSNPLCHQSGCCSTLMAIRCFRDLGAGAKHHKRASRRMYPTMEISRLPLYRAMSLRAWSAPLKSVAVPETVHLMEWNKQSNMLTGKRVTSRRVLCASSGTMSFRSSSQAVADPCHGLSKRR